MTLIRNDHTSQAISANQHKKRFQTPTASSKIAIKHVHVGTIKARSMPSPTENETSPITFFFKTIE
jgi:hypothetical protein